MVQVLKMYDLVSKEIYGKYGTKNLTKKKIIRYKMIEREIYEKYDNLNENKLNKKSNKRAYLSHTFCRGEKRSEGTIDGFRKNLKSPESEILKCPEHKVKSKIGSRIFC